MGRDENWIRQIRWRHTYFKDIFYFIKSWITDPIKKFINTLLILYFFINSLQKLMKLLLVNHILFVVFICIFVFYIINLFHIFFNTSFRRNLLYLHISYPFKPARLKGEQIKDSHPVKSRQNISLDGFSHFYHPSYSVFFSQTDSVILVGDATLHLAWI